MGFIEVIVELIVVRDLFEPFCSKTRIGKEVCKGITETVLRSPLFSRKKSQIYVLNYTFSTIKEYLSVDLERPTNHY